MLELSEVKSWLGISTDSGNALLLSLITSADADLRAKVGDFDLLDEGLRQLAKQYQLYWIGAQYADRFGEMSNKESSAISAFMRNAVFILRQAVGVATDEIRT